MKKILLILVLSCLVFSVFALDGIVVDVLGKVEKQSGDSWITLKKGDVLVLIEAMKLENEVNAPSDGEIVDVVVSKGQAVASNDLLITMK